jgi:hypothetical protein
VPAFCFFGKSKAGAGVAVGFAVGFAVGLTVGLAVAAGFESELPPLW